MSTPTAPIAIARARFLIDTTPRSADISHVEGSTSHPPAKEIAMIRMGISLFGVSALMLAVPMPAFSQAKKTERIAIADPAKLKDNADFATQGEYLGSSADGKETWGAQVVARGDGKFEAKYLKGGLPGAGGDVKSAVTLKGQRNGSVVELKDGDKLIAVIDGDTIHSKDPKGFPLKKVARTSPTLGAKPPEGAVVLFGQASDIANWENGKLSELSDGQFLAAANVRSKKKFQSFKAHVEFRLAWMPNSTGQQRSNSGCYLQDRYEVQVLDSFGLKGVDNECGGIYRESAPQVNMCLPPMVWQTYDIEFQAAKFDGDGKKTSPATVTVVHNGVTIHDQLKLKAPTPGGKFNKELPEPGALFLQNHGDPVVFRNLWIVEMK